MQYVMPFIVGMIVTMAWLPLLSKLATRWLIIDHPGVRKVHSIPIPRVGGLAMALGVLIAALLTIHLEPADLWFLVAAGVLITFGALDDRFDLDYRIKLVGQILAVVIAVWFGDARIETITLGDRIGLPTWVSLSLSVFFLVGVTNAINLADGLDGLAGGTTFLCLCAVALLSGVGDTGSSTAMALAFAGAVLGFLRFNTYPASVFMGDAGSQLLGFTIGVLSVRATQSATSEISAAIPVLLLALPILDTLSVMVQRLAEGRSPFSADKNHIHHKLLAMGFEHHEAVMVIYMVQGCLFVIAYLMRFESDVLILSVVTAFFGVSITVLQGASRTGWRLRRKPLADPPEPRYLTIFQAPALVSQFSLLVIAIAVSSYATLVVVDAVSMSRDIRVLVVALLAVVATFLAALRTGPLSVIEKAAVYVTATALVYLDAVVLPAGHPMSMVGWIAITVAGLASAVRLRLNNDRRFQITPLDLIVLFMALVVPSLQGALNLPPGGALAIAKLVILFYALEMLVGRAESRALWVRIAAASVLSGLAVRPLLPF